MKDLEVGQSVIASSYTMEDHRFSKLPGKVEVVLEQSVIMSVADQWLVNNANGRICVSKKKLSAADSDEQCTAS
ncbi:hypothetical protein LH991_15550 [Schleiferilactobacillus harbinensis]|jgi:hypothetical protein|uniref:DUF2187 domain-containing protein n=2 Tax=Schleiferilactobacillus harbinensis TaxID=304207 RepID=A0A510TTY9_9LACO|nr:hypothetical protein [Schleiferilactobacillus harbinensis]HAY52956.1 hypothetical protein [Lactobacillus sp.]KRM24114.1 hypothetical protein FC91_GL001512 [Schleiferilactobacillus harbinensis DSM 16991]MBO3092177.1 hypothetical protein [Schleiferilactobacillus harbinensis]MCI1850266.1 hypothetical protein [Schleiferilactobacillus harbinensis]MCT2908793.1 hypothetical protein [Schleiferilactobacillus harbinensis]